MVISDRQEAAKPSKQASATAAPAKAQARFSRFDDPTSAGGHAAAHRRWLLETATTTAAIPTPATAAPTAAEAKPLAAATAATATNTSADAATKQATAGSTEWRTHLAAAIAGLEQETTTPPDTNSAIGRHAALRLLYLADGRREQAVKPIVGVPPAQQDFWSKELFGLATYLDSERNSETSRPRGRGGRASSRHRPATLRTRHAASQEPEFLH